MSQEELEDLARKEAKKKAKEAEKALLKAKVEAKEKMRLKEEQDRLEKAKAAKAAKPVKQEEIQVQDNTIPGEKKDMTGPMSKEYHPKQVEAAWDAWWVKKGFFGANNKTNNPKRFTMVIPPPNVTGTLHLGHGLTSAVEDCITRWHRMNGYETLWVPGTGLLFVLITFNLCRSCWNCDTSYCREKVKKRTE